MSAPGVSVLNYPKLKDAAGFANWKFRVKILLEERNLSEVLKIKKDDALSQEQKEKDAKARSIIVQCLEDKYLEIVKKCLKAADMFVQLEKVFERKSVFNKLYLKKKLLAMRCQAATNLHEHFLKFDELVAELEATSVKLDMCDKVCHLLLTMPSEYDNVITALETLSEEKEMDIDFVKTRLLDAELKLKGENSKSEQQETSFFACYKCGKKGHKSFQCKTHPTNQTRGVRGRNFRRGNYSQGHRAAIAEEKSDSEIFVAESNTENKAIQKDSEVLFVIDSGATHNFVQQKYMKYMTEVKELTEPIKINIANGSILEAKMKGNLKLFYGNVPVEIESYIVENIAHNLLSVSSLMNKGKTVLFRDGNVTIQSKRGTYKGVKLGKLYILKLNLKEERSYGNSDELWHKRLGHLNRKGLKILNLPSSSKVCDVCMRNKSTRLPFQQITRPQSHKIGELIHSDVAGPARTPTKEGHRYFQTIIDDYTHFTHTYLLKQKSEAAQNILDYIKMIEREKDIKVKRIRCDNGGEYSSTYFQKYCKDNGIRVEYTLPYSPQMNGKSERMNRTIYDKARTMLDESKLPRHLWGQAVLTATLLINRCPSRAINNRIPAQMFGNDMMLNKLKVFGSKGWMMIIPKNDKLDQRARPVRMVGYARTGYKVWDPETDSVILTRDVRFDENDLRYTENKENYHEEKSEDKYYYEEEKEIQKSTEKEEISEIKQTENEIESGKTVTRSGREIRKPKHLYSEYELHEAYCLINEGEDPESYSEAITNGWQDAINKELNALKAMNTWNETYLPKGKKAIDTKWVFKTKDNGERKARLVAKGFQIKEEEDFGKNYAPVARISTVRTLLAHATCKGWPLRQLDVPTAFLNGELESEVYIKPPQGLNIQNNKVLKLNRGLYGLKESPKCWNQRFNTYVEKNGFERSLHDFCLYIGKDINVWMVIYVDDMILTGPEGSLDKVIENLKKEFHVKDFGEPKTFLGMEISRNKEYLKITQKRQITRMLEKFGMSECKATSTPIVKGYQKDVNEPLIENVPYRQLIGSLMFVSSFTRPDISYATSYLSQFLDKPTQSTWLQAKRVLRYLKGTEKEGLLYTISGKKSLETYSDADWAGDITDRKSVTGSVTLYNGNVTAWLSRKQTCVSLSTVEAEYVSAATSVCDLLYLKGLYCDLNGLSDLVNCDMQCVLYMDNKGAIQLSKSMENSKRTKHIDIKNHFLKDLIIRKCIEVQYIPTDKNLADLFTKSVSAERLSILKKLMHIN